MLRLDTEYYSPGVYKRRRNTVATSTLGKKNWGKKDEKNQNNGW